MQGFDEMGKKADYRLPASGKDKRFLRRTYLEDTTYKPEQVHSRAVRDSIRTGLGVMAKPLLLLSYHGKNPLYVV